jgi:CrcB protein
MTVLMVVLGAALGAPARYLTDRIVQSHHESAFPWGTLAVNITASFVFGVVTGLGAHLGGDLATFIGTGFCGTLSTYSTFSFETLRLVQDGARFNAAVNLAVTLAAGIGAAAVGWSVGQALV